MNSNTKPIFLERVKLTKVVKLICVEMKWNKEHFKFKEKYILKLVQM